MRKIKTLLCILLATTLLAASCKKDKTVNEIDKLPPATQTGANTFGCLVNGKAWVAHRDDCSIFCDPSFKVFYDGSGGGSLSLNAILINQSQGIDQGILIGFDSTNFKSTFMYSQSSSQSIGFTFIKNNEYIRSWDSLVTCTGLINLSTYNLPVGIVSGTFEFTLTKSGFETIFVTNGRFDKKL